MSNPRILHVSTPISWRGGEQQLAYTHQELSGKGIFQVILCPRGSEMQKYCEEGQILHRAVLKRHSLDLKFAKTLAEEVIRYNINIVHVHDSHAHTFSILAALLYRMVVPIILHRRVDYAVSKSFFSRYKYNHPQIKRIICVSKEVKQVVSQSLKQPEKAIVIHSGIDLNKFESNGTNILRKEFHIPEGVKIIGNVAAVTQQKDYFTFVETAKILLTGNKDIHFFIIGSGDQLEEIKDLVESYKLGDYFTFTGFRNDITKILPSLDILLFTSEKEGLGTTIIDAFAAKVAVVATRAGGIPELVEDGVTGYLANIKDPDALAEKVNILLSDDRLRKKFITNASGKTKGFTKEITAEKILRTYMEVLANTLPNSGS